MPSLYHEAKAACRELNLRPRKRWGQNFLIEPAVIETLVRFLDLERADEILEVGPGLGFVTRRLVSIARQVWAVEVDPVLLQWLRRSPLGSQPGLTLIHGDILKVDWGAVLPERRVKLCANLPYSISTPVLFKIFEQRHRFTSLVLMVQEEVAARLAASPGNKSYGTLSVWCQIHGEILARHGVAARAFFPPPNVRSTILKICLRPEPLMEPRLFPVLRDLLKACFGQRRKTLANGMAKKLGKTGPETGELLRQLGMDPKRRPETLGVDEWIFLVTSLERFLPAGLLGLQER